MEQRNKAMKDRLDHLYAMHAINVQMQDRVAIQEDDNPFMDDEPEQSTPMNSNTRSAKKEQEEEDFIVKNESQQNDHHSTHSPRLQDDYPQLRSHINGSPPLSSSPPSGSPGAFHRHWKENIVSLLFTKDETSFPSLTLL